MGKSFFNRLLLAGEGREGVLRVGGKGESTPLPSPPLHAGEGAELLHFMHGTRGVKGRNLLPLLAGGGREGVLQAGGKFKSTPLPSPLLQAGEGARRACLRLAAGLLLLLAVPAIAMAGGATPPRIVALGGDITETVYALGAEQALVGVDSTSLWPDAAHKLPDVGYVRQLAAEGVLALRPQLILATADAGPPQVIAQLQAAGVRIEKMPVTHTPPEVVAKVRRIGELLDRRDAADRLAGKLEGEYATLAAAVAGMAEHPRVVFLLSAGSGSPMAAGRDTAATHAIALAGGVNAADGFVGYKPVSAEALVALAPEVIVLMHERAEALGGIEGVLKLPGVAQTPAGRARRIVFVDGQALLGFGPRNADRELALQRELAAGRR